MKSCRERQENVGALFWWSILHPPQDSMRWIIGRRIIVDKHSLSVSSRRLDGPNLAYEGH